LLGVSDQEIADAMRRARFSPDVAARELGVSRAWLFARLESCAGVRLAKHLSEADVRVAGEARAWNVVEMAEGLEVSPHALRLRLAQLGLSK
jgi:DNA-binding NtrC family response regulator